MMVTNMFLDLMTDRILSKLVGNATLVSGDRRSSLALNGTYWRCDHVPDAFPGLRRNGVLKRKLTHRRCRERYPEVFLAPVLDDAPDQSVLSCDCP